MTDLATELGLILLLAATLGLFLGRLLCKNREYDERSKNRRLSRDLDDLQGLLEQRDQAALELQAGMQTQSERNAVLEQEKTGLAARLQALQGQHDELLEQVRALEVCELKLGALQEEFDVHKEQARELGMIKASQEEQMEVLRNRLSRTEAALQSSQADTEALAQDKRQLQNELDTRLQALTQMTQSRDQARQEVTDLQAVRLQSATEIERLQSEIAEANAELERLRRLNTQADQDSHKLQTKARALQDQLQGLTAERDDLLQQCQDLRRDGGLLQRQNDGLSQRLSMLSSENDDFRGRLQSLSSRVQTLHGTACRRGS